MPASIFFRRKEGIGDVTRREIKIYWNSDVLKPLFPLIHRDDFEIFNYSTFFWWNTYDIQIETTWL